MTIRFKKLTTFAALAVLSISAQAAPYYGDGDYSLKDATDGYRGIWLNKALKVGGSADHTFEISSGSFSISGTSATLSGSAFSGILGGGLDFNIDMTLKCSSTVSDAGGKYVSVDSAACGLGNQKTGGAVNGSDVDGNTWDFWNWDTGPFYLDGTGSLAGLTMEVEQKPAGGIKPFRMGIGADWDNAFSLGASGWFDIVDTTYTGPLTHYEFRATTGDFNIGLPEPGSLALLALGLVGFAATRRRR